MITPESLKRIVQELAAEEVEGISKKSTVKVFLTGNCEPIRVKVNDKALTAEERPFLNERFLEALIDGMAKAKALQQQKLGKC